MSQLHPDSSTQFKLYMGVKFIEMPPDAVSHIQ
jgi:hypothetical protein